jgi:hypothetical protein
MLGRDQAGGSATTSTFHPTITLRVHQTVSFGRSLISVGLSTPERLSSIGTVATMSSRIDLQPDSTCGLLSYFTQSAPRVKRSPASFDLPRLGCLLLMRSRVLKRDAH